METRSQTTLVEQASMEIADVARANSKLNALVKQAIADGRITATEERDIIAELNNLSREVHEAVVVAQEANYVEREYDFKRKRGMWATPHYYLARQRRAVYLLGGLQGYPPDPTPAPAGMTVRFRVAKQKPLPAVQERKRRDVSR